MKNIIYILTLSVIFNLCITAQTSLGFRYEVFRIDYNITFNPYTDIARHVHETIPISLYLSLTHQFDDKFALTLRPGLLLSGDGPQYDGLELTLSSKYFVYKNIYSLLGLNLHQNWADFSHSNSNKPEEGLFESLLLGGGVRFKDASFELQYLLPFKKHVGNYFNGYTSPIELNYLIKLGIGLEWEL